MSKPQKIRAIGAKPTPEEMEEQSKRAALQKRNSLAEMILASSLNNEAAVRIDDNGKPDFRPAVDAALAAANRLMDKAYGITFPED